MVIPFLVFLASLQAFFFLIPGAPFPFQHFTSFSGHRFPPFLSFPQRDLICPESIGPSIFFMSWFAFIILKESLPQAFEMAQRVETLWVKKTKKTKRIMNNSMNVCAQNKSFQIHRLALESIRWESFIALASDWGSVLWKLTRNGLTPSSGNARA